MKNQLIFALLFTTLIAKAQSVPEDYLTGMTESSSLAFNNDNELLVSETNGGKIYKVTGVETKELFTEIGWGIASMAFDSDNNMFAATSFFADIYKITPDGNASKYLDPDTELSRIIIDNNNNIIYSDGFSDIRKIAPDKTISDFATGFIQAEGLALDSQGNLYVTDRNAQKLIKVAPDGSLTTVLTDVMDIRTVVIDGEDNVYFNQRLNFFDRTIVKYNPNDGTTEQVVDTGFNDVFDLDFNDNGDLFIAMDDKVDIFPSNKYKIGVVYNLATLSIDSVVDQTSFKIFPNPVANTLTISDATTHYTVFDHTGKTVINGKNTTNKISVNKLTSGMYIIKLLSGTNQVSTKKFIKE